MPTQNVNLSNQQAQFVRRNVADGGYSSASEVVRAGLRLLEQQQRLDKLKLRTLRKVSKQAFDEIDLGEYVTVEPDRINEFLAEVSKETTRGRR